MRSAPFSDRVCDMVSLAFCLWTLCSWTVVTAGGTLRALLMLFAGVATAALTATLVVRRRWPAAVESGSAAFTARSADGLSCGIRAVAGAVSLGVWWVIERSGNLVATWWWIAGALILAAFLVLWREDPLPAAAPVAGGGRETALWGLAVACAVVALISHRPDIDDAFYVGLAVRAVDDPAWALLSSDPLHGVPGLPLHMPLYRFHSFELANAALAELTGLPAIYCFHWISATVGGLLLVLAHARLLRRLVPGLWLEAVVLLVVLLVAVGEPHRWYGNFALVRIWQGKALYLFVFLPLTYAYALELGRRPSLRAALLLAAAQVSAVGSSSSALWGAPLAGALALTCLLRPSRRYLLGLAWAMLPAAALLGFAWSLKSEVARTARIAASEPGEALAKALHLVMGDARLLSAGLAAILLAWTVSPPGAARRFAAVVPLGGLALLNPYTESLVGAHVTGPSFWRALWAVPVPLLMVLVLVSPMRLPVPARWSWVRTPAVAVLVSAFVLLVPSYSALSAKNGNLRLGIPRLKVEETGYSYAEALNRLAGPGALVLAPGAVNAWIPTFHGHSEPLLVRNYLRSYSLQFLGTEDVHRREVMVASVTGWNRSPEAERLFREGLGHYPLRGVCLSLRRPAPVRAALVQAGFRLTVAGDEYEIWLGGDPAGSLAVSPPGKSP